ncbi:hypothetical protein F4778DRAFT_137935 [Xylariomycetidae sp. FL2044]|nr:hypothetical protein F4778DRAFT_137935 [Xylariomycetidae sp. FL2044]
MAPAWTNPRIEVDWDQLTKEPENGEQWSENRSIEVLQTMYEEISRAGEALDHSTGLHIAFVVRSLMGNFHGASSNVTGLRLVIKTYEHHHHPGPEENGHGGHPQRPLQPDTAHSMMICLESTDDQLRFFAGARGNDIKREILNRFANNYSFAMESPVGRHGSAFSTPPQVVWFHWGGITQMQFIPMGHPPVEQILPYLCRNHFRLLAISGRPTEEEIQQQELWQDNELDVGSETTWLTPMPSAGWASTSHTGSNGTGSNGTGGN